MDCTHTTGVKRRFYCFLNVVDVVLMFGLVALLFNWFKFPITFIRVVEIGVAIYYRYRVVQDKDGNGNGKAKKTDEKSEPGSPASRVDSFDFAQGYDGPWNEKRSLSPSTSKALRDTIGAVVGWREEDDLFAQCLESMKRVACFSTVVVGVDGDSPEDAPMRAVFKQVFPNAPAPVHFDMPTGESIEVAEGLLGDRAEVDINVILDRVEATLVQQLGMSTLMSASAFCVYQPHQCKKSILFTVFLVSLVLGRLGRGEFVWSSDSDSIVLPGVVEGAITHVRRHPNAGGAAGRLRNRPNSDSMISKIIGSKYWFDQDVTRSQTAVSGDAECQPGPCTVTRTCALREVVVEWYNQRFLGRRVITNEDRHLTTRLLRRGWKVYYIPESIVETDSPITLFAWIRQQNRWSRGTHIERLSQPMTYAVKHPWFTVHVWKEQIIPVLAMICICTFVATGEMWMRISAADFAISLVIELVYVMLTTPDRPTRDDLIWLLPAQLFYNTVKPAIHLWALITLFESGWKSSFSADSFARRFYEVGPIVFWMNIVVAFWGRAITASINSFNHDLLPKHLLTIFLPICFLPVWMYVFCGDHFFRRRPKVAS